MLSVEPILERTFLMSGTAAVPGRLVGLLLVDVVVLVTVEEVLMRGFRGTRGFFSVVVVVPVLEESMADLVATVRVRATPAVLRVLLVLGLLESVAEVMSWISKPFIVLFCFYCSILKHF